MGHPKRNTIDKVTKYINIREKVGGITPREKTVLPKRTEKTKTNQIKETHRNARIGFGTAQGADRCVLDGVDGGK